jgi:hypothetical protein
MLHEVSAQAHDVLWCYYMYTPCDMPPKHAGTACFLAKLLLLLTLSQALTLTYTYA